MFLRMPPFLRFLKLFLMIFSIWSDNLLASAQFTIPGGVHYHWHWDEQDQKIIRRVYESHENYTFTAYKFPEPDYTAQYVFIAFVTFCSLASFVCFGLIVYEVTRMVKRRRLEKKRERFDLEGLGQQSQQQPKSNGDYAFFLNRDITLQQKLGSGKFGSVWRAVVEPKVVDGTSPSSSSEQQQPPLQGQSSPPTSNTSNTGVKKDVAVKVFTGKDERSLSMERFIYDLPGMAHPNLLRYLAAFELRPYEHLPSEDSKKKKKRKKERENQNIPPSNRTFWLVTEYHRTGSLYDYLSRQKNSEKFTVHQLLSLVHGLASGLSFLHNFGDYHHHGRQGMSSIALRDFKSANIILAENGNGSLRPLIADLGLAVVFLGGEAFGQALERVGTPRYMAPEVLSGHLDLTTPAAYLAVDMYALGLVLWELLSRTEVEGETEENFESYRPPYQEYFREDGGGEGRRVPPSVAEMHSLVVGRRLRPSVKSGWFGRNSRGGVQVVVAESMVDCWDVDGEARLKAATLLMRMEALILEGEKEEGQGSSGEGGSKEVENEVFEV